MLNRFYQAVLLSFALSASTAQAAFSLPFLPTLHYLHWSSEEGRGQKAAMLKEQYGGGFNPPTNNDYWTDALVGQVSELQNVDDVNMPYCYMQTADGRTLNLEKICGKASEAVRFKGRNSRVGYQGAGTSFNGQSGPISNLGVRLRAGSGYDEDAR